MNYRAAAKDSEGTTRSWQVVDSRIMFEPFQEDRMLTALTYLVGGPRQAKYKSEAGEDESHYTHTGPAG